MRFPKRLQVLDFTMVLDDAMALYAFHLYLEKEKYSDKTIGQAIEVHPPTEFPKRFVGRRTVKMAGEWHQFAFEVDTDITALSDDSLLISVMLRSIKPQRESYVKKYRGGADYTITLPLRQTLLDLAKVRLEMARSEKEQSKNASVLIECLAFVGCEPEEIGTSYEELDQFLKVAA